MKKASALRVTDYIARCPKHVRGTLRKIRAAIREAAPGAKERTDYFQFPGYSYAGGYDYDGMFAWFSYKEPFVRVHIRPEALDMHAKTLTAFKRSRGAVSFREDAEIPMTLVKKLVRASVRVMKEKRSVRARGSLH